MLDALKDRIRQIEELPDVALPIAAKRMEDSLRGHVRETRRAGQRRRKLAREALKISGFSHKEIKARVRMPKRKKSGVSIDAFVQDDAVVVRASETVQLIARRKGETDELVDIFHETVERVGKAVG